MKFHRYFLIIFGVLLIVGCGQGEQKDPATKAENPSRQKAKETDKLGGVRLQQGARAMNKAAEVEKELAKKAEETERKIDQESK